MNPWRREPYARVIVTGATTWTDAALIETVLGELAHHAGTRGHGLTVLTGMADGADAIGRRWARCREVDLYAEPLGPGEYPDPMHDYNEQLLRLEPDIVVAFKDPFDEAWASDTCIAGTEHMCRIAAQPGLPVYLNGWHRLVASGFAGGSAEPPPVSLSQQ